jgi:hypothetical protein
VAQLSNLQYLDCDSPEPPAALTLDGYSKLQALNQLQFLKLSVVNRPIDPASLDHGYDSKAPVLGESSATLINKVSCSGRQQHAPN